MESPSCLLSLPQQPKESDCCGQGCQSCVFDLYEKELAIWKKKNSCSVQIQKSRSTMTPDDYTSCTIEKVDKYCCDVLIFYLKLPQSVSFTFNPGQHVVVQEVLCEGGSVVRAYTPATAPGTVTNFRLVVKCYENGVMSNIIRTKWLPGYSVSCRGPVGKSVYRPNVFHTVVLVALGTGITPVFHIGCAVKENPDDETRVVILYGCKTYSEILLRPDLHEMQDYWNFRIRYFLSDDITRQADSMRKHNECIDYFRISANDVWQEIKNVPPNLPYAVFLCGSKSFERQMKDSLSCFEVVNENIYTFG